MIHKESHTEVEYSVVEASGAAAGLSAIVPGRGDTLPQQAEDVLRTAGQLFRRETAGRS